MIIIGFIFKLNSGIIIMAFIIQNILINYYLQVLVS